MQVRAGSESRGAHVADNLLLAYVLSDMHPRRESGEMAIAGLDAVGVSQLDQIPVATVAAGFRHDAVGRRAHWGSVGRRVIGPLVRSPALENRMEAIAEAARDVAEPERRA